ncbi:probable ATP-dependent DNA helicase RecS isoform X1 [Acanthochromis polyacanthus]|nr:probable ATP-dependent DNA helicase RecS isoform X1 [Acanthochromis polyacanthus]
MAAAAFDQALDRVLNSLERPFILKQEQRLALEAFVNKKKDVLALLPTGFGKSLIYQLAPLVAKEIGSIKTPVVVVVSPLIALIEDQIKEAADLGISATQLGLGEEKDIKSCRYQVVFGSPEAWLSAKWENVLSTEAYKTNLIGIVVDEVHLTYKWGNAGRGQKAFRESFARLGELRAIVKPGTPVLALTASADLHSRDIVRRRLHFQNAVNIIVSPNRPNIRLAVRRLVTDSLDCFDWLVKNLKERRLDMLPVIIYCRTINTVTRVFLHLKSELGDSAWVGEEKKGDNLLIGMFHSHTLPVNKSRVLSSINGEGNCRVAVATTALGVGLNFPKVSHVIMYGLPEDPEAILQQVGRAGRDGSPAHAVLYANKQVANTDNAAKTVLQESLNGCFRKALYSHFEEEVSSIKPGHSCCTFCHTVCKCNSDCCSVATPSFEMSKKNLSPVRCRKVTLHEQGQVKELLEKYRDSLIPPDEHLYTNVSLCTGFSNVLIETVIESLPEIFNITDIMSNLPVFDIKHGQEILRIVHKVFKDFDLCDFPDTCEELYLPPDIDFTGYFDFQDEDEDTTKSLSSIASGLSLLPLSD